MAIYKIDSNVTGLRYAEEDTPKTLPVTPIWYPLEPNSYTGMGGKLTTIARKPISQSRQQQKGTITDLEASGGFEQDLTMYNTTRLLQGFMFADAHEKKTTQPMNTLHAAVVMGAVDGNAETYAAASGFVQAAVAASNSSWGTSGFDTTVVATTAGYSSNRWTVALVGNSATGAGAVINVDSGSYSVVIHYESGVSTVSNVETAITALAGLDDVIGVGTPGTGATVLTAPTSDVTATHLAGGKDVFSFLVNHLVYFSGFAVSTNNGMKLLSNSADGLLTATGCDTEASPPAVAKAEAVGYQFATSTLDVTTSGLPRLVRASGVFDFTTLNLTPGEWIYVGGDESITRFGNNKGFARVSAVAAAYIELDKTDWTPQVETGTGKTVRIFFGTVIKNEKDPYLIKRRTYQLERTLGMDTVGTMSEYLVGASANEFTLNIKTADKITAALNFVALDNEQRTGATGVKTGTRPSNVIGDAFNTSSDFSRIKLAAVSTTNAAPTALFAYATDMTLKLTNNVTAIKAIGVLGGFDTTAGMFVVDGNLTCYFADIAGVQAVRNNSDITIDAAIVKKNAGFVFDIPLLTLGNGQAAIEQDKPITLPFDMSASESKFGHTFMINVFPYLPTVAE